MAGQGLKDLQSSNISFSFENKAMNDQEVGPALCTIGPALCTIALLKVH